MKNNKGILVVSGYNMRAVVAFCRWAESNCIKFHIVAKDRTDPIFLTKYKQNVELTRDSPILTVDLIKSWMQVIISKYHYNKILVLPLTEYLNRFLLENRDKIEGAQCTIPLVEKSIYEKLSDKESFAHLCQSQSLDVPAEYKEMPSELPYVAKPKSYFSSKGCQLVPQLIHTKKEAHNFCENENQDDYFFQKFIGGKSIYLLAYVAKFSEDILFSQENLVQQARGKSVILAKKTNFHHSIVAERYIKLLHQIKFHGLVMIEFKKDDGDEYYMIEANPRPWGPMQLCIDNGVNLFGKMLEEHGFFKQKSVIVSQPTKYYYWSGGMSNAAQPLAFHDFSPQDFISNFPEINNNDLFRRGDTIDLFLNETK